MKAIIATGEFPNWNPSQPGFSHAAWNKANSKRLAESGIEHSSKSLGYRMRHARQLLARIAQGALSPQAVLAVERDYAKEFRKLRAGSTASLGASKASKARKTRAAS